MPTPNLRFNLIAEDGSALMRDFGLSARQQSTARSEWLVGQMRQSLKTFANQSNIENARA
jgi:hypothetical protein